ncbi:hypothetical protein ACUUL3_04850 [Thiovibrio sp. JS02]
MDLECGELHKAARDGNAAGVKELLENGCDVNQTAGPFGPTPIQCAAWQRLDELDPGEWPAKEDEILETVMLLAENGGDWSRRYAFTKGSVPLEKVRDFLVFMQKYKERGLSIGSIRAMYNNGAVRLAVMDLAGVSNETVMEVFEKTQKRPRPVRL